MFSGRSESMIIWGDKVGLRRFEDRLSEAEMRRLYEWSRDPEVLQWSGGSALEIPYEEFREHVEGEQRYGPSNRRAFLILRRENLELIGRLGLFAIDWTKRQGELGIIIGEKRYWNQGYGRDAITTLLQHIFRTTSLTRVYLFTFDSNLRAQHAFAAAGFRVVSRVQRVLPDIGQFEGLEMEIVRTDFLPAAQDAATGPSDQPVKGK